VVTFKHPGRHSDACRQRSVEELERLPRHMRQAEVCERGRAPVRMRVSLDGVSIVDESFPANGIWSDGNSVAVAPLRISPGEHQVRVEIGDSRDADEWTYTTEHTLEFGERDRRVIAFDRVSGFSVY
jgi:hypothetical protein